MRKRTQKEYVKLYKDYIKHNIALKEIIPCNWHQWIWRKIIGMPTHWKHTPIESVRVGKNKDNLFEIPTLDSKILTYKKFQKWQRN